MGARAQATAGWHGNSRLDTTDAGCTSLLGAILIPSPGSIGAGARANSLPRFAHPRSSFDVRTHLLLC